MKCIFILLTVFEGGAIHVNTCTIASVEETTCTANSGDQKPCTLIMYQGGKASVKEAVPAVLAKLPKS